MQCVSASWMPLEGTFWHMVSRYVTCRTVWFGTTAECETRQEWAALILSLTEPAPKHAGKSEHPRPFWFGPWRDPTSSPSACVTKLFLNAISPLALLLDAYVPFQLHVPKCRTAPHPMWLWLWWRSVPSGIQECTIVLCNLTSWHLYVFYNKGNKTILNIYHTFLRFLDIP